MRVLALLTDFGPDGPYVASMKGVILGICPDAVIVDVSHAVPPQQVIEASLLLRDCHAWFPSGTVFVAVVDPDVGTSRRAVALEADGRFYVGPDNGIFSAVLERAGDVRAVQLTEPRFWLHPVSATFEGRDRFAPVGAWLCGGLDLDALGEPVTDLRRLALPRCVVVADGVEGAVVRADRFGNLLTSIDQSGLAVLAAGEGPWEVRVAGVAEPLALVRTYADLAPLQLGALVGSSGWLEICVRGASAAERLGGVLAQRVRVTRGAGR